jgi:hypothetical protein
MARRVWPTQVAESVPFDNENNDFEADNVQDAIEEAFEEAAGAFEELEVQPEFTTTTNGWTTMAGWPQTFSSREAGKKFLLNYTAKVGQSDKEKQVGSRVQWRSGTSGGWTTLPGSTAKDGVSSDDEYQLRTSFNTVTPTSTDVVQVRWQIGQTDDGGTGKIRNAVITIANILEP